MPENELILFLETPRAGGERGHRWLIPGASRPVPETEITEWSRLLEQPEETDKIVAARRQVGQVIGGNTRDAWESLAAVNVPSLDSDQREKITGLLREFLYRFDPDRIDWEKGSGLVVSTTELDTLYYDLQELVLTRPDRSTPHPSPPEIRRSDGSSANAPPRSKRGPKGGRPRIGCSVGIVAAIFALFALFQLLPDGGAPGEAVDGDPVWNAFLTFREEALLARISHTG